MRSLFSPCFSYPTKILFQLARSHRQVYSSPPSSTRRPSNSMAIPPKPVGASVIPSEESFARRCWIKSRRECVMSLYSPFALCLASGSLMIEPFRHYIAQDVHFLKAFAQAYELAEDCADDDDAKLAISDLRKSVLQELKMHNSFVQEWGCDSVKEFPVNSATVKYTEFLLATASGKIEELKAPRKLATPFEKTKVAAYTLGAMTPCMRLYAFLGKEFQALLKPSEQDHPYRKWMKNYSSEGFQASAVQTEDLLDKLSAPLTGEELDVIEKLYHQAMKLEIEFFYAQPLTQRTVIPLANEHDPAQDHFLICSDFDLTCTAVDSSAILAEIAIVRAQKSDQNQTESQTHRLSSAELRSIWDQISTEYTEEYERCIESILPSDKVEFNYEALHKALEQVSDFEKKANSTVIAAGVLKGLNLEAVKHAGEHMTLQDGCISFFHKIVKNENINANVHVLSYCWCADLIRAVFYSGGLEGVNIHANEFTYEESVSTGEIVWNMQSPIDKVQAFNNILQECSSNRKRQLVVYIGDSVGDLLCLLKADIGIVVGSSSSLRRVATQYGVSFVPLFPGLVKKQKEYAAGTENTSIWGGESGILYTVSSWDEIHAIFFGQ